MILTASANAQSNVQAPSQSEGRIVFLGWTESFDYSVWLSDVEPGDFVVIFPETGDRVDTWTQPDSGLHITVSPEVREYGGTHNLFVHIREEFAEYENFLDSDDQRPGRFTFPDHWDPPTIDPPGLITPELRPDPDTVTPSLRPNPDTVTPELRPAPDTLTPGLRPVPDVVTPGLRPDPDLVTPGLRPDPGTLTPQLRPDVDVVTPELRPSFDIVTPGLRPTPDPISPEIRPNPDTVTPELRPAPDTITPGLRPDPDVLTPGLRPDPGLVTPGLRPAPDVVTPELRPDPGLVTPELRPTPGTVTPGLRPDPGTLTPELRPDVDIVTPERRPSFDIVTPGLRPTPDPISPEVRPDPDTVTPELRPAPDTITPGLRPGPDVLTPGLRPDPGLVTPELRPGPNPVTPGLRPDPDIITPELRPDPGLVTPGMRPAPDTVTPGIRPDPGILTPELRPNVDTVTPELRPNPDTVTPGLRPGPDTVTPELRPGPDAITPGLRPQPITVPPGLRPDPPPPVGVRPVLDERRAVLSVAELCREGREGRVKADAQAIERACEIDAASKRRWSAWGEWAYTSLSDHRFGAEAEGSLHRLTVGLDRRTNASTVAGVAIDLGRSTYESFHGGLRQETKDVALRPYVVHRFGSSPVLLDASIAFDFSNYRETVLVLTGDHDSFALSAAGGISTQHTEGGFILRPRLSVSYARIWHDAFALRGELGGLALTVRQSEARSDFGMTAASLEVSRPIRAGGSTVTPYLGGEIAYTFQRPNHGLILTPTLNLASAATITGAVRLGARTQLRANVALVGSLEYDGIGSGGLSSWQWRTYLAYRF